MPDGDDFRQIALGLEGTTEAPHFDRFAFRVKRTYATLAADGLSANLKFTPDDQAFKCMMAPDVFAPLPNKWGQAGWTTVTLAALDMSELKSALFAAWSDAARRSRRRG